MLTQREITVPVDSPVQNRWVFFALMAAVLAPLRKASFMILGGKNKQKNFKQAQPCRCSRISAAVFLNGFIYDVTEEPTEHKPFTYVLFFFTALSYFLSVC